MPVAELGIFGASVDEGNVLVTLLVFVVLPNACPVRLPKAYVKETYIELLLYLLLMLIVLLASIVADVLLIVATGIVTVNVDVFSPIGVPPLLAVYVLQVIVPLALVLVIFAKKESGGVKETLVLCVLEPIAPVNPWKLYDNS